MPTTTDGGRNDLADPADTGRTDVADQDEDGEDSGAGDEPAPSEPSPELAAAAARHGVAAGDGETRHKRPSKAPPWARELRESVESQRQQLDDANRTISQLTGALSVLRSQSQTPTATVDPEKELDAALEGVEREQQALSIQARAEKDAGRHAGMVKEYQALERKKVRLAAEHIADRKVKSLEERTRSRGASSASDPRVDRTNRMLWREYPSLMEHIDGNTARIQVVRGMYSDLAREKNGGRDSEALLRQAAAKAQQFWGLGQVRRGAGGAAFAGMAGGGGAESNDEMEISPEAKALIEKAKRWGVTEAGVKRHAKSVVAEAADKARRGAS